MTKKEYCLKHPAIGYYSGLNGFEIHGFEYGVNDYLYGVSGAWGNPKHYGYHKLMIHHDRNGAFFRLRGYKCRLDDCIRMNGGF
jgi:hypothetical protein